MSGGSERVRFSVLLYKGVDAESKRVRAVVSALGDRMLFMVLGKSISGGGNVGRGHCFQAVDTGGLRCDLIKGSGIQVCEREKMKTVPVGEGKIVRVYSDFLYIIDILQAGDIGAQRFKTRQCQRGDIF